MWPLLLFLSLVVSPIQGEGSAGAIVQSLITMINTLIPKDDLQRIAPSLMGLGASDGVVTASPQRESEQRARFVSQFAAALETEAKAHAAARSATSASLVEPAESPFSNVMQNSVSSNYPYFGVVPKVKHAPPLGPSPEMGYGDSDACLT
jgi:hypothetical protein